MTETITTRDPAEGGPGRLVILGMLALCLLLLGSTASAEFRCESFDPSDEAGVARLEKQYRLLPPDQVHHYEGVFNACLEAGEAGSADAAYRLGVMYFVGIGTERSLRRALVWLHRAEKRGSADAAFMLAVFYLQGIGVKQNDERARILFLKAALAGIANAQTHMGHYYSEEGPGQDLGEAYRWYRAAAEQGRSIAQVELGRMYRDGRGIA